MARQPATRAHAVQERIQETLQGFCVVLVRWSGPSARANCGLRQKLRQAGTFHSLAGLIAAIALVIAHRDLSAAPDRDDWTGVLEAAFLAA